MNTHGRRRRKDKVAKEIYPKLSEVKWEDFQVGMKIADYVGDEGIICAILKDKGELLIEWNYPDIDLGQHEEDEPDLLILAEQFDYILDEDKSYTDIDNFGKNRYYGLCCFKPMEKRTKDTKIARKVHGVPDRVENGYLIYEVV